MTEIRELRVRVQELEAENARLKTWNEEEDNRRIIIAAENVDLKRENTKLQVDAARWHRIKDVMLVLSQMPLSGHWYWSYRNTNKLLTFEQQVDQDIQTTEPTTNTKEE